MSDPRTDDEIRALLEERRGYEVTGRTDRAAQVDEQLKARGYAVPTARRTPDEASETTAPRRTRKG